MSGVNWNQQFLYILLTFIAGCLFLVYVYAINTSTSICHSPNFDPIVDSYLTFLVGGNLSLWASQIMRMFVATNGFSDGKLRHPYATYMVMIISTIQMSCNVLTLARVIDFTCEDFLGIRTPVFIWIEWLCTVPYMFFLISILDVKRTEAKEVDKKIQMVGGWSMFFLFLGNIPLPRWLNWTSFVISNVAMVLALAWQQLEAYEEYVLAIDEFNTAFKKENSYENVNKDIYDRFRISQCKMNCASFVSFFFSVFPLIYYLHWFQLYDANIFIVLIMICSFLAKVLFIQIVTDSHVEILDPNKMLLVEEKKKAEESRLMFLRYVFHEVRVPLNSVALGLQLLQDSSSNFSEEDRETISLMREATGFMAETLNDVLSLQKIEEGMLELELKPFQPHTLIRAVISNFRTQYESKKIVVKSYINPNVPKYILGDQFRLEHVLGNLLSNAIKFSDRESEILISVNYESKVKGFVTFSVIDQGPGMTPEEQAMLFQPFKQIRPGELQKGRGTGLGLSICKTIVSLHHGTIGCVSKQRQDNDIRSGGSEFFFNIECKGWVDEKVESQDGTTEYSSENTDDKGVANQNSSDNNRENLKVEIAPTSNGVNPSGARSPISHPSKLNEGVNTNSNNGVYRVEDGIVRNGLKIKSFQNVHSAVAHHHIDRKNTSSPSTQILETTNMNKRSLFRNDTDFIPEMSSNSPRVMSLTQSTSKTNLAEISEESELDSLPARKTDVAIQIGTTVKGEVDDQMIPVKSISKDGWLGDDQIDITTKAPTITPECGSASTSSKVQNNNNNVTPKATSLIDHVLIVDDVLSNRKMLDMILRKKGFHCEQAADGSEAIDLVIRRGVDYYDIIFMDSVMPNTCGPEAAQKIRSLGFSKLLVGVTGNAMDIDVLEYEACGADVILTKPMRMDSLQKLLEHIEVSGGCKSHHKHDIPIERRVKTWIYG